MRVHNEALRATFSTTLDGQQCDNLDEYKIIEIVDTSIPGSEE